MALADKARAVASLLALRADPPAEVAALEKQLEELSKAHAALLADANEAGQVLDDALRAYGPPLPPPPP